MTIKQIKKKYGLKDKDLAEMAGLKSAGAFRNSTAKARVEQLIINCYELFTSKK